VAFCRISDDPIRIRANINEPDMVVVLDYSILRIVDVTAGLKSPHGILVTDSKFPGEKVRADLKIKGKLAAVNATGIAREVLGLAITNTTMLGSLVKATNVVQKDSLIEPLKERFGRIAEKNIVAYERAYKETVVLDE
jgi:pyruvate ferredoxin oxidoreductase gamma subunit